MGVLLEALGLGILSWLAWNGFQRIRRSALDNIPGPRSPSMLTGHFGDLKTNKFWEFVEELAEKYGHVVKLEGLFGTKFLQVSDPAALHTMFVKDPSAFEETPRFLIGNALLFGAGVASATGAAHRKQRKLLNPAFSPSHLREIAPVFFNISEQLCRAITTQVRDGPREINVASWSARAALEIIGQGAMGYSFDSLVDSVSNDYTTAVRVLMPTVFSVFIHWLVTPWFVHFGPPKFRAWVMDLYPNVKVRKLKSIVDLLWHKAVILVDQKKAALEAGEDRTQSIGGGKDIMSILLRANMTATQEDRLPDEQIVAQVNTFLFAASDTSANGLSRMLHTLAHNADAQDKLRKEIADFRASGDELTYERLIELPYLDAVVRESLRVYPPTVSVDRIAQRDIVLPVSKPFTDVRGEVVREFPVPKGTNISINIHSYNRNKDIWGEDAAEWKPERWLTSLPDNAKNASSGGVYHNLMTFLGGPRACIGFKYAELEIKTFMFYLVESFKFSSSGRNIVWNNSFTVFPSVMGDTQGEMPLRVELVRQEGT